MTSSDLWDEDAARRYDEPRPRCSPPRCWTRPSTFLARLAGRARAGVRHRHGPGGDPARRPRYPGDRHRAVRADGGPAAPQGSARRVAGRRRATWRRRPCPASSRSSTSCGTASATCAPRTSRSSASATPPGTWRPGGRFVIELWVPRHPPLPAGAGRRCPSTSTDEHLGFDTYDMATQQGTSHHYRRLDDGTIRYGASNFRYIWPAECDLMAQLAGLSSSTGWPTGPRPRSPPTARATSPSGVSSDQVNGRPPSIS